MCNGRSTEGCQVFKIFEILFKKVLRTFGEPRGYNPYAMNLSSQVKQFVILWLLSIVISVYRALTLMFLWNWFVTRALHLDAISFLVMLGVSWLVELLTYHPDHEAAFYAQSIFPLALLCVPEANLEAAQQQMEQLKSDTWKRFWGGAGHRAFQITLTLGLGFVVSLFL